MTPAMTAKIMTQMGTPSRLCTSVSSGIAVVTS